MEKVKFNVSSKTARLIGRENISDSNGAIIELVKNAYDADAENAYIQFDIPYEDIPNEINISVLKNNFTETEISIIKTGYELNDNKYIKKKKLSEEELEKLKDIFFSKNKIIIVDNGTGMDEDIIKNVWMNIGTDDKEINVYSKKGRIKTGAKGIGRFALEKLSLQTEVYTKKENKPTVYWSIDWTQFDKVKLLDEINAEVQIKKENFKEILQEILKDNYKYVENYDAEHGTIIILKQTRETWNEKIFSRINNNLNSINPFGNTDKFNILLRNLVRPDLNFKTNDIFMSKEHYDYRIKAEFDGNEKIKMYMERNEIDLNAKQQKKVINDKEYTFDIQEFWKRKAFSQKNYQKEDYDKVIEYDINVKDLIENESEDQIKKVGKFSFELYFLKSGKSEYSIIKDIKVNKRKELLKKFSGIKLYRDNFKVRPYGEDGPMYDWLGLGKRAQLSPAGVTHPTGFWRVEPYQLIGNINISRNDNKNLTDMANRESLALNETYYLFVEIIQKIISKFEYDRQYVYREYGNWLKLKTDRISKSYQVIKDVVKEKENNNGREKENNNKQHTEEEYKDAVYESFKEKQSQTDTNRILMNFSSAGIIASTFSHEISKIATDLGSRNQQLESCIDYILDYKEYKGDPLFDPYKQISKYTSTDELLSTWVNLIMDGVSKDSFEVEDVNLTEFMNNFRNKWIKLLEQKGIEVELNFTEQINIKISKIDLYLIFNNLYLNSAWFLEKKDGGKRKISITLIKNSDMIDISFKNNGPKLNEKYKYNPDQIFEPGETSKEEGTGLGLWICKDAVNRNNGEIHTIQIENGFKIIINFPIGD